MWYLIVMQIIRRLTSCLLPIRMSLGRLLVRFGRKFDSSLSFRVSRKLLDFQLDSEVVRQIARRCGRKTSVLVFGLGTDAIAWESLVAPGNLAIIENDQAWIRKIQPWLRHAHLVYCDYDTEVTSDEILRGLESCPDYPRLKLGATNVKSWDIVVVDGPRGGSLGDPGRFQSIAEAARLVKTSGVVVVDDWSRPIERLETSKHFSEPPVMVQLGRATCAFYGGWQRRNCYQEA